MNCYEIIIKYLKDNNYDGLHDAGRCACTIDDLMPCDEFILSCEPGYKVIPPKGVCCEYDFYICDDKKDKPWEM